MFDLGGTPAVASDNCHLERAREQKETDLVPPDN
jgi:hypothetical protein